MTMEVTDLIAVIAFVAGCGLCLGMVIRDAMGHHFRKLRQCGRCGALIDEQWTGVILPRGYAKKRRTYLCDACRYALIDSEPFEIPKRKKGGDPS